MEIPQNILSEEEQKTLKKSLVSQPVYEGEPLPELFVSNS